MTDFRENTMNRLLLVEFPSNYRIGYMWSLLIIYRIIRRKEKNNIYVHHDQDAKY